VGRDACADPGVAGTPGRRAAPAVGQLELLARSLRGQIESVADQDGSTVLVDDLEISWSELGGLLATYEGWHIRIEIRDPCEAFDE